MGPFTGMGHLSRHGAPLKQGMPPFKQTEPLNKAWGTSQEKAGMGTFQARPWGAFRQGAWGALDKAWEPLSRARAPFNRHGHLSSKAWHLSSKAWNLSTRHGHLSTRPGVPLDRHGNLSARPRAPFNSMGTYQQGLGHLSARHETFHSMEHLSTRPGPPFNKAWEPLNKAWSTFQQGLGYL
ncbi:hypothetical protein AVEN_259980-1 [Araneus ventricosus]|uniref:Uncharacterized protein n=1 Tax=Araneus ventricosus TaxID=182803 RepID=A0A4Y2SE52_ARAVE|nr:hypothetical protein AVEN_259980-1 [Araneus ventricosus]